MDLASLIAGIASVPGIGPYMVYISFTLTMAVTICSILATCMPASTPKSSSFYAFIYKLVNLVALSFGHARNLSSPDSAGIVGGPGAIENPLVATMVRPAAAPLSALSSPLKSVLAFALVLFCSSFLSACGPNAASSATAPVLSAASADVARAETIYGVAKGEAQVALLADPSLAPYVNTAIAKADPIAAALQSNTPAALGIVASAASLIDQAVALENATAQAIKVVPSAATK